MSPQEEVTDSPTGWVAKHVHRYLETDGEEGHEWRGAPTLLLTTRGRRAGTPRRTALVYGEDGGGRAGAGGPRGAGRAHAAAPHPRPQVGHPAPHGADLRRRRRGPLRAGGLQGRSEGAPAVGPQPGREPGGRARGGRPPGSP